MKGLHKKLLVTVLTALALFCAQTSAYACTNWVLYEPKMPESLILKD